MISSAVFVLGLTGNRTRTWSHEGLLWPKDLLPKTLLNARIMTFGYDVDVVNLGSAAGQNRIGHRASNLVRSLEDIRDGTGTVRLKALGHHVQGHQADCREE